MNCKSRIATILLGIVFPIIILITASEYAIFDRNFFLSEMDKNEVTTMTGLPNKELYATADQIFAFLKNERADFNIYGEKENDLYVPLFTNDEITHMEDVRGILKNVVYVQAICIVIFMIGIIVLLFFNQSGIAKGIFWGSVCGIVVLVGIGILAYFDFTSLFVALHRMVFSNELWYLDPAKSILINIVPEQYFIDLALRMALYTASILGVAAILSGIAYKKMGQKKFMKNSKRKF